VRWLPPLQRPTFGCVVGWGLKPTTKRARALSKKSDAEFLALEDGFLRSVLPGPDTIPLSLVIDRTGVHYDSAESCDLERLIEQSASNLDRRRLRRARKGIATLGRHALSKYNHAPRRTAKALGLSPNRRLGRVLVVDQTAGDCSISYGNASARSFDEMMAAAQRENPGAEILLKVHPEVVSGRKSGHLTKVDGPSIRIIDFDVNPWSLLDQVDTVYVVTSQLGLEALFARKRVVCFGAPFYAGWGLTDDRVATQRRTARPTLEQLFAAIYFDYCRYLSPQSRNLIHFEAAVTSLIKERRRVAHIDELGWPVAGA